MALYRGLDGISDQKRGIALGVFDGVHLGHQQLIGRLRQASASRGLVPSAMTFAYPKGRGFDGQALDHAFLMTEEDRVQALFDQGLEDVFLLPLTEAFCHLSPFDFLDGLITKTLGGAVLALGQDGHFGWRGAGDVDFLKDFSRQHPLTPLVVGDVTWGGDKVSSSRIRQALAKGLVEDARAMMTRPFRLTGQVIAGKKLGSTMGFPTANILYPGQSSLLRRGVYMTRVGLAGGRVYPAITNLGLAPTVLRPDPQLRVESFLYDFSADLYGQVIQVDFLAFIRPEETFASLDRLRAQVERDRETVRALHAL